jgi:hypothetical protein
MSVCLSIYTRGINSFQHCTVMRASGMKRPRNLLSSQYGVHMTHQALEKKEDNIYLPRMHQEATSQSNADSSPMDTMRPLSMNT